MSVTVAAYCEDGIGFATLDRPEKLNALDTATLTQLVDALSAFDANPEIRAIVIGGSDRAFAAGADIGDLATAGSMEMLTSGFSEHWDAVAAIETPLIAAVRGYALGGGLELALICDIIIAGESAVFGLPETSIGTIPGAGGTQRLVRAVGKSVAMEMILAGRRLASHDALAMGLVSAVVPDDELTSAARATAHRIRSNAPLAVKLAKRAVLESFETSLSAGVRYERTLSAVIASSLDRAAGAQAFAEKRAPQFTGR